MSNSVQPHRWQPTRLPHPWDSPGKNTGVGCHFLLQCMKVRSESEVTQSCPTQRPHGLQLTRLSVHGIFQARVLEWVASAFSESKRRWHFKTITFLFLVSSSGNHLLSFFTFPICLKCQMTIEWSMLSSSATSLLRGSASMMALNRSLSTSYDQLYYTPHLQGSCLLYKTSWTTTALYVCSSSWVKCIVDVVSRLYCFTTHFDLE